MAQPPAHVPRPDWPTFYDAIGWKDHLTTLAERIAHCQTPQVFGIHGDWGSGKTSFARQLQYNLGGDPDPGCDQPSNLAPINNLTTDRYKDDIVTIWFEAWRYQNEPVPVVALLQEMRRQFSITKRFTDQFGKLAEVTSRALLNSFSEISKRIGFDGLPSTEKIQSIGEQWEKDHFAQRLGTDSTSTSLQQAIEALLPERKLDANDEPFSGITSRVVVFIDDLDRCNPDTAFKLLEGIKVYLSIPKCVFVLAMNESAIQEAIAKNLPSLKKAENEDADAQRLRAAHYLEKLCTNIYRLPEPADSHTIFTSFIDDVKQKEALNLILAKLGKNTLPPNPRRLKALANQWRRLAAIHWDGSKPDLELQELAAHLLVVAYIYQFHTALWQLWRFNTDFWRVIEGWVNGSWVKGNWIKSDRDDEDKSDKGSKTEKDWRSRFDVLALPPNTRREDAAPQEFVDPAESNVFWIAALIRANSALFTARSFAPYLKNA